jgi:hypothetical protein
MSAAGKLERIAEIESRARKLARSGEHRSYLTIRTVLNGAYPQEARFVFRNKWQQHELDRLCEHAALQAAAQKIPYPA